MGFQLWETFRSKRRLGAPLRASERGPRRPPSHTSAAQRNCRDDRRAQLAAGMTREFARQFVGEGRHVNDGMVLQRDCPVNGYSG